MDKDRMIWIASLAIGKGWDFEKLKWSDEMYSNMDEADEVYEYVVECQEIGTLAWKEKYGELKLYI